MMRGRDVSLILRSAAARGTTDGRFVFEFGIQRVENQATKAGSYCRRGYARSTLPLRNSKEREIPIHFLISWRCVTVSHESMAVIPTITHEDNSSTGGGAGERGTG